MYVVVQHTISEPAVFWNSADPNNLPPEVKLHHTFSTPDGTRAVCIWEARSVDTVREFLEPLLGERQPERVLRGGEPRGRRAAVPGATDGGRQLALILRPLPERSEGAGDGAETLLLFPGGPSRLVPSGHPLRRLTLRRAGSYGVGEPIGRSEREAVMEDWLLPLQQGRAGGGLGPIHLPPPSADLRRHPSLHPGLRRRDGALRAAVREAAPRRHAAPARAR